MCPSMVGLNDVGDGWLGGQQIALAIVGKELCEASCAKSRPHFTVLPIGKGAIQNRTEDATPVCRPGPAADNGDGVHANSGGPQGVESIPHRKRNALEHGLANARSTVLKREPNEH